MFNQGPGKKSASGKEGISVYGLFRQFAYTPQGRAKLKQMFFRPSLSLETIRERHDFIAMLSRPGNSAALEKTTKGLKHIKNLRSVMINLHKGISTGSAKITGFKATVWARLLTVCSFTAFKCLLLIQFFSLLSIRSTSMMHFARFQEQRSWLYEQRLKHSI